MGDLVIDGGAEVNGQGLQGRAHHFATDSAACRFVNNVRCIVVETPGVGALEVVFGTFSGVGH